MYVCKYACIEMHMHIVCKCMYVDARTNACVCGCACASACVCTTCMASELFDFKKDKSISCFPCIIHIILPT